MQPSQTEHLKNLIEQSQVLTPQERAEWLDMLILMNDKQASELEEILGAKQAASVAATVPPPVAPPPNLPIRSGAPTKPPHLTHISNLPAGLGGNASPAPGPSKPQLSPAPPVPARTVPAPRPASAQDWRKEIDQRVTEKELPAPKTNQATVATRPIQAPRPEQKPAAPVPPSQSSGPRGPAKRLPLHLENLADAGRLDVSSLRNSDPADLAVRLQQLVRMEGYFNLLAYLEDSPLYKAYIATGKKILSSQGEFLPLTGSGNTLTKAEFEEFNDTLRKIQVS